MRSPGNHLISKFNVDFSYPDQQGYRSIQSRIHYLIQKDLGTLLEEIFDQFCPPNERIVIEEIHIDLGVIEEDYLESVLLERLETKLQGLFIR